MEYHPYEEKQKGKKWGLLGSIAALLFAFGGKLKFLLPVLKLLKLGKVGGTIWSMMLMAWTYALIYPWSFAVGFVSMLFIHEMGHVWAAKRKGLPVTAPTFIPFIGALITLKKQPQDAQTEAYIALGGPLLGSIGALLALGLGVMTGSEIFFAIAWVGFFLNLINLLPIHPLDGGRIVTAISRWLWLVGLVGGLFVIIYLRAFIFLFFWILFAWELYQTYVRKRRTKEREGFEILRVPKSLFEENYLPIPGAEHSRKLDYVHYCNIEDQTAYIDVNYPGLGKIGSFAFPYGTVTEVSLRGSETAMEQDEVLLNIYFKFIPNDEMNIIREEGYYQVPAKVRMIYGIAYFGLAVLLAWLMYVTSQVTPGVVQVG